MQQLAGDDLKNMLIAGSRLLKRNRDIINALNTFPVPDGDTGTNMDLTLNSALVELEKVQENSVSSVAGAIAVGSLLGARGNSGVILSQLFRGFAKFLEGKESVSPRDFSLAMHEGVKTAYKAVMKPVEGTILTIARESAKTAMNSAGQNENFQSLMQEVVRQAADVLEKTPDMLPILKETGVVDAGGKGLLHIYEGFLFYLQGEDVPEEEVVGEIEYVKPQQYISSDEIIHAYCTELMVQGQHLDADAVRGMIAPFGDSVLTAGDEKLVKIHIHTNNPGQVLEKCLLHGSLHNIKIENMKEQHAQILFSPENKQAGREIAADGLATIAVSAGDGLAGIMTSLGVHKIIRGGQTMNPSTEEFLQAVKEIPQKEIIILPNNKNIVLAAEQVKELTEKEVRVVKTRSVPQGIAAMLAFDSQQSLEENVNKMEIAANQVKSGQVTYAICDSKINGKEIRINDCIAIFEDEIVAVGNDENCVVKDLLYRMVNDDVELITLYAGEPVSTEDAGLLRDELVNLFNGKDVEMYEGGQPFYYYLVSVE